MPRPPRIDPRRGPFIAACASSGARLPPPVRAAVLPVLAERLGRSADVVSTRPVGGGCINPSARIELDTGDAFFLKWNASHPALFGAEAEGLEALAGRGALRVPEVVGFGSGEASGPGWLLLEFVPRGRPSADYDVALAEGLSALHAAEGTGGGSWGWTAHNFIGSLPQPNTPHDSWAAFWVHERIGPQLARAREKGFFIDDGSSWDELARRADRLLAPAEDEGPSLLHGDLWSGNVYPGPAGEPVLVDPAVYRGHREVDLAMTELFGGFGEAFYRRYEEVRPLAPGYDAVRRHVYQLYPLLVHVNLFGGGYVARTLEALERALRG